MFYVIEHGKENMTEIIIVVGLQRNVDEGDVVYLSLSLPQKVAAKLLAEQESCALLNECGDLTELLNAYAVLCGYQCAIFVCAAEAEDIENSPLRKCANEFARFLENGGNE